MIAIRKLCFLVPSCLALVSTFVRDDRPTPSPPYYGLPISLRNTNSIDTSVTSSSSLVIISSVLTVKVSFGSHSSTHASTVHQSQESISITTTHVMETFGEHKSTGETSTRYMNRKSTPRAVHHSLTSATQSPRSSGRLPSSAGSMLSQKTSVISQSRSSTASRPNALKSSASSFPPAKPSADHKKTPTRRPSQPKVISGGSWTGPTTTLVKHSTKRTKIATSLTHMISTSMKAKPSTYMRTSQPIRTSAATRKSTKQLTSSLPRQKTRADSSMPSGFLVTKTSTSRPPKVISATTSPSKRKSTMPNSQNLPTTNTNPKNQPSSVRRDTSSSTTKNIGTTITRNSPSLTLGHTTGQDTTQTTPSTRPKSHSAASQNSISSATTKQPVGLIPTRSTALPAPTKKYTSTITATTGQSASIPRSTATMATRRPIETIVTSSKGIVATYRATQDPKYTTNRRTSTTTDDHEHDIVIFPGGWRWIPIGLPPLRLPPPPKSNPDPNPTDDHGHDDDGHSDDGHSEDGHSDDGHSDDGHNNDDHTSHSKSTTNSARCTTTEPPKCTKTVSFISGGTGFRSTIFGTCSPISGCVSGEQSTTTTTIAATLPVIWINEPLDSDIFSPADDIDHDTIQYFNDVFEKQGISIHGVNPQASCSGHTAGISVSCLNSIYPTFCKEVEADLSKKLTKSFTGLENLTGSRIARSGMVSRRILKKNTCDNWTLQLSWNGSHGKCDKSCSESFGIIGEQCIKDKSSNKASLDIGCGTYHLEVKTASKTATAQLVLSTLTKTSQKTPSSSSTRTKVPSKSTSTSTRASSVTATTDATTESFSLNPTDSSYMPLVVNSAVCEDEANLPGHAPINEEHQGQLASFACLSLQLVHHISSMDSHSEPITYSANPDGTSYFYSISWIDGCETAVESQDPSLPLGNSLSPLCSSVLTWAYDWCDNGGVGGYIDVGCLRYQFIGGK